MRETIKITTPDSWKDISLKKYLDLQKDLEAYKDDEDAQLDFMLYHLCGIDVDKIHTLTKESYEVLRTSIFNLLSQQDLPLQTTISVDGVEYGFEPNLSKMSYGAYVDITKNDTIAMNDNWAKIMSILYRPIVKKNKDKYTITSYEGYIDEDIWYDVPMDVHFGAWFFFVHLSTDLSNSILNSTIQKSELPPSIKLTLEKNGKAIQQLLNSQEEISKRLMK